MLGSQKLSDRLYWKLMPMTWSLGRARRKMRSKSSQEVGLSKMKQFEVVAGLLGRRSLYSPTKPSLRCTSFDAGGHMREAGS